MKFALFPLSFLLSIAAAQETGAPGAIPSPTCLCNGPLESSELPVVIILIATTAFFALTTVVLAAILILLLIRKLKRISNENQQREPAECKYWEDAPTLEETLAADSKQPNIWYSMDTKTFQQGGGSKDSTDDTTGSNEVVTLQTKTKNQPKRRAPPPPAKSGGKKGFRKKKKTTTAEYEIPTTHGKKKSTYKELDLDQLQPPSEYAALTQPHQPQRGRRTPSAPSGSTSQVKPM